MMNASPLSSSDETYLRRVRDHGRGVTPFLRALRNTFACQVRFTSHFGRKREREADDARHTTLGYNFVSILRPLLFQSIFPRYSSLVPPAYVRAESTYRSRRVLHTNDGGKPADVEDNARQGSTYLGMSVTREDVQDGFDVFQVVHTRTCIFQLFSA